MVVLGCLKTPHGVRGWLKLASYTEPDDNIFNYRPWYLEDPVRGWKQIDVLAEKRHGTGFVIQLSGIEDRDKAGALRGRKIAIEEGCLPPPPANEYYWRDLIGLDVFDVLGEHLGRVKNMLETGANDVLVVVRESGGAGQAGVDSPVVSMGDPAQEQLIPFIDPVVRDVDLARGRMTVDWEALE